MPDMASTIGAYAGQSYGVSTVFPKPEIDR
jgi:hypothetical protein